MGNILRFLLSIFVLFQSVYCTIFGEQTQFQGVSSKSNQIVEFNSETVFKYDLCTVNPTSEFTLLVWIMIQPQTQNAIIFESDSAFTFEIKQGRQLYCSGLSIDYDFINGIWYIILFQSRPQQTILSIFDYTISPIAQTQKSQFINQSGQVWLKNAQLGPGLFGSLKNIQLYSTFLTKEEIQTAAFTYIHPFEDLLMIVVLNSLEPHDIADQLCRKAPVQISGNPTESLHQYPSTFCYSQDYPFSKEDTLPYTFEVFPSVQLFQYTLSSTYDLYSQYDRFFTLKVWFMRLPGKNIFSEEQLLFEHDGVMRVYITNGGYIGIKPANALPTTYTQQKAVPFNQWFYLEAIVNFQQYGVTVISQSGQQWLTNYESGNGWPNHSSNLSPKTIVWIGQEFSGLIYNLRYQTDQSHQSQPPKQSFSMSPKEFVSNNILIQFSFVRETRVTDLAFANLARKKQRSRILPQQTLLATLNPDDLIQAVWHEPNSQFKSGFLADASKFDGITCKNSNGEELELGGVNATLTSTFSLEESTTEFTLEFWFKQSGGNRQNDFSLAQIHKDSNPLISIRVVENKLFCFPTLPSTKAGARLLYPTYRQENREWQYIACTFSFDSKQITGVLQTQEETKHSFALLLELQQDFQRIFAAASDYQLLLGNNTDQPSLQFKEVRFWSTVREPSQLLKENRSQIQKSANLKLYLPLQNGNNIIEIVQQQNVSIYGGFWKQYSENSLLICPYLTYSNGERGQNQLCKRDYFQSNLQPKIGKTEKGDYYIWIILQNQEGNLVFSDQISNKLRWSLLNQKNLFNNTQIDADTQLQQRLITNHDSSLLLPQIYLLDQSLYDLNVEFIGEPLEQNFNQRFTLITDYCTQFLDSESRQVLIEKDLNFEKESQQIHLNYTVTECDQFKQTSTTFEVLNHPEIRGTLQNNSFIIPIEQQQKLPLNQRFQIIASAQFVSKPNPSLTYTLSLTYKLRFVSKVVVKLEGSLAAVPRGESLILNSTDVQLLNFQPGQQKWITYSREWLCPKPLSVICATDEAVLEIPFSLFESVNLQYWTKYPITIRLNFGFTQGDSTHSSQSTFQMLWVNLAPGDGIISGLTEVDIKQDSVYTVDFDEVIEDQVEIRWFLEPQTNDYISKLNQRQVNLKAGTLKPHTEYELRAELIFKGDQPQLISSAFYKIQSLPLPQVGTFTITPGEGVAVQTVFVVTLSDKKEWINCDLFQLFIQTKEQIRALTSYLLFEEVNGFEIVLPPCSQLIIRAYYNKTTSYTETKLNLQISSPTFTPDMIGKYTTLLSIDSFDPQIQKDLIDWQIQNLTNTDLSINQRLHLEQLDLISKVYKVYQAELGLQIQLLFKQVVSNNFHSVLHLLRNSETMSLILRIQSNLLKGCEWLELSRQFDSWHSETDIEYVTKAARNLLVSFEEAYSDLMAESDTFEYETEAFTIFMQKDSSMTPNSLDLQRSVGSKLAFKFPLESACQSSVRQTLTVIGFRANPFLAAHPMNQTVISNSSLYVSYRDVYGYSFPQECVQTPIDATLFYKFTPFFVEEITTCGYYTNSDQKFLNDSCVTSFNQTNDRFTCQCSYQNQPVWYSVLEDHYIRPPALDPQFAVFRDWATFATLAYTSCFTLIGLMYAYGQDLNDFKRLRDIQLRKDSDLMKNRDCPLDLTSLAQKRQVALMPYADQYSLFRFWILLLLHTHPLLSLRYQLDPQLLKLNKFVLLAGRIWISMLVTFLLVGRSTQLGAVDLALGGIALSAQVLLVTSLPNIAYQKLKQKYRLRVSPNQQKLHSDNINKRVKLIDEAVYECDTNLPIRLLFILNSMPLLTNTTKVSEMRFAAGKPRDLAEKLLQLDQKQQQQSSQVLEGGSSEQSYYDEETDNQEQEYRSEYYSSYESQPTDELPKVQNAESAVTPLKDEDDVIETEESRGVVNEREVKLGQQKVSATFNSSTVEQDQMPLQLIHSSPFTRLQEKPEDLEQNVKEEEPNVTQFTQAVQQTISQIDIEQSPPASPKKESQITESSLDSQVFDDEKKEFYEASYNFEAASWLYGIVLISVGLVLGPSIWLFNSKKIYAQEFNIIWPIVYFAGHLISMIIVNPLICFIVAWYVNKVRSKKKGRTNAAELLFVCKWLRESLIVYEDYRFAVQFQQSTIN